MISPELLRKFPFFGPFTEDQLNSFAMMAEEKSCRKDCILFEEGDPADYLLLLLEGNVDLCFRSEEEYHPQKTKTLFVGNINPGEIFAISSIVEPYILNARGKATRESKYIQIDAKKLRNLLDADPVIGYVFCKQIAKVMKDRLASTRVQLAAAWA